MAVGSMIVCTAGWIVQQQSLALLATPITLATWKLPAVVCLHAALLKCCLGVRSLGGAALCVLEPLAKHDEPTARQQLAWHLVSRDVQVLSAQEISAATIESVAENTSDSVIAPLFFYVIAGLPGALFYRYINTCDAMLGYRTVEFEWLGKVAARLDDVLNLIPARITAGLMVVASLSLPTAAARGWRTWQRDASRTASPNAGRPMSVAAGVLGVCLEKPNHYRLGSEFRPPEAADIRRMLNLFARTVTLAVLLACSTLWVWDVFAFRRVSS